MNLDIGTKILVTGIVAFHYDTKWNEHEHRSKVYNGSMKTAEETAFDSPQEAFVTGVTRRSTGKYHAECGHGGYGYAPDDSDPEEAYLAVDKIHRVILWRRTPGGREQMSLESQIKSAANPTPAKPLPNGCVVMDRAVPIHKGFLMDDTGTVRRVLGTLPVTADGCVAAIGGNVWYFHNQLGPLPAGILDIKMSDHPNDPPIAYLRTPGGEEFELRVEALYSTAQAALDTGAKGDV